MYGRKLSLAVSGQSLAHRFRLHGRRAFAARLAAIAPWAPPVQVWGFTRGGSLAASTNRFPAHMGRGQHFWWDMDADAPSPAFAAGIAAQARFLAQPADCLFWDLGQFEAVSASGRLGHDPDRVVADFARATVRCLAWWRTRLAPADPARLPILLMPHAPHVNEGKTSGHGVLRIRAAQQGLAAALPNCHVLPVIAGMDMEDNLHPSPAGVALYAAHVADAFAQVVLAEDGPLAAKVARWRAGRDDAGARKADVRERD